MKTSQVTTFICNVENTKSFDTTCVFYDHVTDGAVQYPVAWGCFSTKYWNNVTKNPKCLKMTHELLLSHSLISKRHLNRVVETKMYEYLNFDISVLIHPPLVVSNLGQF